MADDGQRIRGITDDEASDELRAFFRANERILGRVSNLNRVIAHSPGIVKWWLPLMAAIRQPDAGAVSDVRLRNLAILRTSILNGCAY